MMETIKVEVIASGILCVLVGVVAYFLKQLLADFKKVEKDLTEVKNTTALIKAEFNGNQKLTNQKIAFMDARLTKVENVLFNIPEHENK